MRRWTANADALQKCLDNEFYDEFATRYQAVQLNCNTVHANASAQRSQYQSSIGSLDISIQTAVGDKSKLNQMLSDIRNRENNFSVEEVYYHAAVEEYINRYNFTAGQYDSQITQLRETEKSDEGNTDYEKKIETLQTEKAQSLNQLEAEMLASVEQSLSAVESNLQNLQMNRSEAENHLDNLQNGSEELNVDLIVVNEKNAVYAELNTCKNRVSEYETTLASLKNRIAECTVSAQIDGYLNLSADKVAGDYVGAGETLGTIIPEENKSYRVVLYVENQDIGQICKDQTVRYEIPAYPSSEYGRIQGKIQKISKDMKVNQEHGSGYYAVEATISYDNGKELEFIQGMALEAKVVTDQKSILKYLLEKIDLLDN